MTDQEKRLRRANLQIELEDAQSELAYLRDDAQIMADELGKIITKLQQSAGKAPSSADFSVDGELEDRLDPGQQLDINAVRSLISGMRTARQRVHNLQQRRSNLLQADGIMVA